MTRFKATFTAGGFSPQTDQVQPNFGRGTHFTALAGGSRLEPDQERLVRWFLPAVFYSPLCHLDCHRSSKYTSVQGK
jgi:hypothetical protein